jgi:hypothetical protein
MTPQQQGRPRNKGPLVERRPAQLTPATHELAKRIADEQHMKLFEVLHQAVIMLADTWGVEDDD